MWRQYYLIYILSGVHGTVLPQAVWNSLCTAFKGLMMVVVIYARIQMHNVLQLLFVS